MKRLLLILLLIFISIITFSQGTYDWHEHYNVLHNTKHGYNLDYRIWLLSFLFLASILLMYYSGFFKTKRSSEIKDIKKVKQNNQNHNYQTGYTHLDSTDKLKEIKEQYESEDFWGVIRNIRNKIHELSIAECNELLEFIKGNNKIEPNLHNPRNVKTIIYFYMTEGNTKIIGKLKEILNERIINKKKKSG